MTRSILMYERYYHDSLARKYHLQYFLLIDEVIFGDNSLDVYGVKVAVFRDEAFLEQRSIRGITPFGPTIASILNRLADSLATPNTMERMVLDAAPA